MRLIVCSTDTSIPLESVKSVANKLANILNIECDFIPEHAGNSSVSTFNLNQFSALVYGKYIEAETPFVCVAFTKEFVEEDCILGSPLDQKRIAFVTWSDNIDEDVTMALHELGHFFGIDGHCHRQNCVMLPYYNELKIDNAHINDIFCDSCFQTIKSGSCFSSIKSTAPKKGLSSLIFGSKKTPTTQNTHPEPSEESKNTFPDKSTCNPDNPNEYLYRVLRYYQKKRR
jgi:hypothetical protein